MTTRRLLALAAALTSATVAATMASAVPATARTVSDRSVSARCLDRGPIPVHALRAASRSGCSLVGRMVTDGRVSVMVPPAGMSVAGDGLSRHGDVQGLTVTNTGRTVKAVHRSHGVGGQYLAPLSSTTSTTTTSTTSTTSSTSTLGKISGRAGSPAACKDRTYHLEHHRWAGKLRYRVNLNRMPKRFGAKTVIRQIKVANGNMRKGRNNCGKPRLRTPHSHYGGRTKARPNIRSGGPTCGQGNRSNIVAFGNLPGGLLGWTCYWWVNPSGRLVGADMLLDNGKDMTTHLPKNCQNQWDFEGTVTHEWGHAYGMAHTGSGHQNLTMQHLLAPCSKYARTLGLGDWLGMNKMYGHR